jgi:hypothetical protein
LRESQSKGLYRVVDVNEDLFEERKGEAETLAGFILEISGIFSKKSVFKLFIYRRGSG